MKSKSFIKILICLLFPFYTTAQNHCEYVNIGCDEQNTPVLFDQIFMPEDPVIINVIPSPTILTSSIAFDGQYLWVGSTLDSSIYKISPDDGAIINSIHTIISRPYGLIFDGEYFWATDNETGTIHKVDPSSGNSLFIFDAPFQGFVGGLAYDGEKLWHADSDADSIYVINLNGEVLDSRKINLPIPIALTFVGEDLWVGDNQFQEIFRLDTTSWVFLDTINSPKWFPNGLAFDGQYLWLAENMDALGQDSIYQIDIGLPPVSTKKVFDESIVDIFPNPTSNTFQVRLKTENEYLSRITISTIDGKQVFQFNLKDQNLDNYEVSLADQSPGIYLCQIIIDDQVLVKKIVKQ